MPENNTTLILKYSNIYDISEKGTEATLTEAIEVANKTNNMLDRADAYYWLARFHEDNGSKVYALAYYEKALADFRQQGDVVKSEALPGIENVIAHIEKIIAELTPESIYKDLLQVNSGENTDEAISKLSKLLQDEEKVSARALMHLQLACYYEEQLDTSSNTEYLKHAHEMAMYHCKEADNLYSVLLYPDGDSDDESIENYADLEKHLQSVAKLERKLSSPTSRINRKPFTTYVQSYVENCLAIDEEVDDKASNERTEDEASGVKSKKKKEIRVDLDVDSTIIVSEPFESNDATSVRSIKFDAGPPPIELVIKRPLKTNDPATEAEINREGEILAALSMNMNRGIASPLNLNNSSGSLPSFSTDMDKSYLSPKSVLIMEHAGVNVKDYLHDKSLDEKAAVMLGMINCVDQLHTSNYVHCDLKPSNFTVKQYLKSKPQVKIIDFGTNKLPGEVMKITSPDMLPFEAWNLDNKVIAKFSLDVGMLGFVLLSLIQNGETPHNCFKNFPKDEYEELKHDRFRDMKRMKIISDYMRQHFREDYNTIFADNYDLPPLMKLIGEMIHPDVEKRISLKDAKESLKKIVPEHMLPYEMESAEHIATPSVHNFNKKQKPVITQLPTHDAYLPPRTRKDKTLSGVIEKVINLNKEYAQRTPNKSKKTSVKVEDNEKQKSEQTNPTTNPSYLNSKLEKAKKYRNNIDKALLLLQRVKKINNAKKEEDKCNPTPPNSEARKFRGGVYSGLRSNPYQPQLSSQAEKTKENSTQEPGHDGSPCYPKPPVNKRRNKF